MKGQLTITVRVGHISHLDKVLDKVDEIRKRHPKAKVYIEVQ